MPEDHLHPLSDAESVDQLIQYGHTLIELRRYQDAENHFATVAARHPQDWRSHYYLALARLSQADDDHTEKAQDGLKEAARAVGLQPDHASCHFLLSLGYLLSHKYQQALDSAHSGMRLDPEDPWGYSLVAQVHLVKREWQKALLAADTGLRIDPEYSSLLNSRAEALIMLGKKDEATAAVQLALEHDPSSARSHANKGWLALYQNQTAQAIQHFRDAMRLDPTSESGRSGLMTALQARNPLYRLILRYYLWTSRLTHNEFWAGIVLISGFNRLLRVAARAFPPLLIIVLPYLLLFALFSYFTWVADSIFNYMTRLSPTGRLILSKDEKWSANGCAFLGSVFAINTAAFIMIVFTNFDAFSKLWVFFLGAAISAGMMVPMSGFFKIEPRYKKQRTLLLVIAILMGSCGICAWAGSFTLQPWHGVALFGFICSMIIYPWIGNLAITSTR